MSISQKIKSRRVQLKMTQEQLAENSGLNLRTIQRIENNETVPRGDTLHRIAEVLKLGREEIIGIDQKEGRNVLLLLSLSQLTFLLFPLLGIIVPMAIWMVSKEKDQAIDEKGKRIIAIQIIWTSLIFLFFMAYVFFRINHLSGSQYLLMPIPAVYLINILMILVDTTKIYRGKVSTYFQFSFFK